MVTELTVPQRLDYWTRKIGVGSVWLTQEFNTAYVAVMGIEYDRSHDRFVVSYVRKDMPGLIHQEVVQYFLEYTASHRA